MKILITGTHFTPAQAVIEELQRNNKIRIIYLGRKHTLEGDSSKSVESQILPKMGVKFIPLISGRLQRSFNPYTILSILKIPIGFIQSFFLVVREQPDVILSFGGYTAVPTVISAWFLSIPIIIHEQTLVTGFANIVSSWFADRILISFPENKNFNPDKTLLTGNPMREELDKSSGSPDFREIVFAAKKEKMPLILITGGNQGSHIINQTVCDSLENLNKEAFIVHQTGDSKDNDYEKLLEKSKNLKHPRRYLSVKWIDAADFGFILKNTDLAIGRGGINTLLELAYFNVPALIIPIPFLYKNEQMANAKYFESEGLVQILSQQKLTPQSLTATIKSMLADLPKLKENAKKASSVIIPDAAKRVALETVLLARKP